MKIMKAPSRRSSRVPSYLKVVFGISGMAPILWSMISTPAPTHNFHEEDLSLPSSFHKHLSAYPESIRDLTNTHRNHEEDEKACLDKSFVYIYDVIDSKQTAPSDRKIPKIIHQTSKSRCLTKMFAQVSQPWRTLKGYDYYLHDDHAMRRLLATQSDEFPFLHQIVKADCLPHGTLRADIWRYLVLYLYGGIYADIDTQPTALFNTTQSIIQDSDDGWFVVEQFHILSQYVMAVSPRHPLMYYAIHHSINKVMAQVDTKKINAALVTGPHSLHRALQEFCQDAGIRVDPQGAGFKPVKAGIWNGTNQRSITVVGRGEFEGEFITREMLSLPLKKRQYAKMNMTSFREDRMHASGHSCLSALFQYHQHNRQQNK